MIEAVLIDDEQHCTDHLQRLLTSHFREEIKIMAVCSSVKAGLEAIKRHSPSLVFLDVQIHEQTGFDLLQQLPTVNFEVIFTTAWDRYAVQAFRFSALDYLLKPIDPEDLRRAIQKFKEKQSLQETAAKLDVLFHNLKQLNGHSKRICVPVTSGLVFVQVHDIVHCESQVNYTTLHLKDKKKMVVAKTLKEFEEMLTDHNFFRVHHSHLINLGYVASYNKGGFVVMQDDTEIAVSTRRKEDFLKRLAG